ncbi:type II toxin-antitoxin system toxin endoribonuclease MazF3 [soil metagenome]
MIRGDVCYHTFKEPDKRRPVLILTRTSAIAFLNDISIAPITSTLRDRETSVWLDESDGMLKPCAVNLDYIQTVPKHKLGKIITHLSDERMAEVFEAVKFAFGFEK